MWRRRPASDLIPTTSDRNTPFPLKSGHARRRHCKMPPHYKVRNARCQIVSTKACTMADVKMLFVLRHVRP